MIRFLKNRIARGAYLSQSFALGSLEFELMEVLWSHGESSVRDVVSKLSRPLAYTTVMTTLDRLFKKGLLDRHKSIAPLFIRHNFPARNGNADARGIWWPAFCLAPIPPANSWFLVCWMLSASMTPFFSTTSKRKIRSRRKELLRQGQP